MPRKHDSVIQRAEGIESDNNGAQAAQQELYGGADQIFLLAHEMAECAWEERGVRVNFGCELAVTSTREETTLFTVGLRS
jgi:hypothetical protein